MMLDDLLRLVPGLRKFRTLNAATLRKMLDRAKGECTWCGDPVPKGRRTWCSTSCLEQFNLRCTTAGILGFVQKRDRSRCQACGRCTKQAQIEFNTALRLAPWHADGGWRKPLYHKRKRALMKSFGWGGGGWGQADHIVPVAEGGGLTGPENFQWLCGACHAAKTKQHRKRDAK